MTDRSDDRAAPFGEPRTEAPAERSGEPSESERARWERRYAAAREVGAIGEHHPPSRWVLERCHALPPGATVVDLACGTGRHAIPLAIDGFRVIALDLIERAVAAVRDGAPSVSPVVADASALPLRDGAADAIVCVSFLDRSVVPRLHRFLRPGGILIYETFTVDHGALVEAGRAHGPRNPAFLLDRGELASLVAPLEVAERREGLVVDTAGERHVASVMAVKRS